VFFRVLLFLDPILASTPSTLTMSNKVGDAGKLERAAGTVSTSGTEVFGRLDWIGFGLTRYWTGFSVHDDSLDWMHASLVGFLLN